MLACAQSFYLFSVCKSSPFTLHFFSYYFYNHYYFPESFLSLLLHQRRRHTKARFLRCSLTFVNQPLIIYIIYWTTVIRKISAMFGKNLNLTPLSCILGLHSALNLKPNRLKLIYILLFGTSSFTLLQWVSYKHSNLRECKE